MRSRSRSVGGFSLTLMALTMIANGAWAATPTYYTDRGTFEAALAETVIDDYAPPTYPAGFNIYNNATMSAFFGETDYFSTGFPDLNFHLDGDAYCAGCNGSFLLSFQTTSLTVGGIGVLGVGVDILTNDTSVPYVAFVTFGDGTTGEVSLPAGPSFFGVTAPELIESVHFGLSGGAPTTNGSFSIDNLTIGGGVPVELQSFIVE